MIELPMILQQIFFSEEKDVYEPHYFHMQQLESIAIYEDVYNIFFLHHLLLLF